MVSVMLKIDDGLKDTNMAFNTRNNDIILSGYSNGFGNPGFVAATEAHFLCPFYSIHVHCNRSNGGAQPFYILLRHKDWNRQSFQSLNQNRDIFNQLFILVNERERRS